MGYGVWVFLSCAYLVLATEDLSKNLAPVQWSGAKDASGRTTGPTGLVTRAQIYKDYAFLCIPRLKPGIEATLVKKCMTPHGPEKPCLEAFPSWKSQMEGNCECLQSAVDIYLDNQILFVLDSGESTKNRCPPKVVGIDVTTGKIVNTIDLSGMISHISRLQFLAVDYSDEGERFLYVCDAGTKSIIVWNVSQNRGHRVMLPANILPDYSPRDVLYIALIKKEAGNVLFFTYRSGDKLCCIETKYLQKDASSAKSWDVGKKPAKMIILGTDDWDCMYFRYESKADVYKWNTSTVFNESNFHIVHSGSQSPLIPTHAIPDYNRGVMRIVESNLVEYLSSGARPADAVNSLAVMQVV